MKVRNYSPAIIITSILLVALRIIVHFVNSSIDIYFGFAILVLLPTLFLLLIAQITTIISRKSIRLSRTLLPGAFAFFIVFFFLQIIEVFKSSMVLRAYSEHTITTNSLVLRENHTFEYDMPGFMSGSEVFKGSYTIVDDTLLLHFEKPYPPSIMGTRFIFKNSSLWDLDTTKEYRETFNIRENRLK